MTPRERASRAVQSVKAPIVAWPLGLAVIAFAGVMLYREPPADKLHMGFWGGLIVIGLGILPGVLPFVAANLRPLVGLVKSAKSASGPDGKSSDGSSP